MSDIRPFFLSKAPYWQIIHMRQFSPFGRIEVANKSAYWICNAIAVLGILSFFVGSYLTKETDSSFVTIAFIILFLISFSPLIILNFFKSGYTMKKFKDKSKP